MNAVLLIKLLEALAGLVADVTPLIAQGEVVMSDTDAAAIHDALNKAEAATAALRPQVDAVLSAAAVS